MDFLTAVFYGIVQGITEWLPVSSTAHLRLLPVVLGQPDPGAAFTAVIQLGTLLAVLIYFWKDLSRIFVAWARSVPSGDRSAPDARLGWGIFFGSIPIVIFGLAFRHAIEGRLRSLVVVGTSLIVIGIVMLIAERFGTKRRKLEDLTVRDGLIVGLWQAIALIPGASRSGSTISGGLFQGFDRATAARYSFLLSVPSVLAAGLKELWDARHVILGSQLAPTLVATAVSFIVGYASIAWLIGYLQRHSTAVFVAYRVLLGATILALVMTGRVADSHPVSTEPAHVSQATQ